MKDIKIDTPFLKFQYWVSWFGFIFMGMLWAWITAILLANVGKVTSADVKGKKNILNKTWQKFVFVYGVIVGDIFLIALIIGIIFA